MTWVTLATIGLVLSFVMPFGGIQGIGAAIWLNVMHLVAGVIIIPMVAKALPAERQS